MNFSKNIQKKIKWSVSYLFFLLITLTLISICIANYWYNPIWFGPLDARRYILYFFSMLMVTGPGLVFLLINENKSKKGIFFDSALIIIIQFFILFAGVKWIYDQRPIILVYEKDRFVLLKASEIDEKLISLAPIELQDVETSRRNILVAATRDPLTGEEMLQGFKLSMDGISPAYRPNWWINYSSLNKEYYEKYKKNYKNMKNCSNLLFFNKKLISEEGDYFPLVTSNNENWGVLLSESKELIGIFKCEEYCY